MATLQEYFRNPIVWFVVWIFLAITNNQLYDLIAKVGGLLGSPFQAGMSGTNELQEQSKNVVSSGKKYIEGMKKLIVSSLAQFIKVINSFAEPIRENVRILINMVAPEDKRIWRVFGALVQMVLFGFFIYADAIQGANNLSVLFPTINVIQPLRDITFSLIIASVGVCVSLGIILADIFGLTNFAPVDKIQGRGKVIYVSIAGLTLIISIILSTILALSRVPSLVESFDEGAKEILLRNASYAQSLIILPLLITTAFLYWGAVGVLILICGLLLLASFSLKVFGFFLSFLKIAIEWGLISTDYLYSFFFGFLNLAMRILYGLFFLLNAVISAAILVAQALLGVIIAPPILISKAFMAVINFFIARFS